MARCGWIPYRPVFRCMASHDRHGHPVFWKDVFSPDRTLQVLYLDNNRLGDEGESIVANYLGAICTVQEMSLSFSITAEVTETIVNILRYDNVQYISVGVF